MPHLSKESDKSAAALAFATMLSEQLLKQQNPMQTEGESMQNMEEPMQEMPQEEFQDASQTLEIAPGEEEVSKVEEMPMEQEKEEDSVLEKIQELKDEGLTKAKVKKAMSQMIDEAYAKENT